MTPTTKYDPRMIYHPSGKQVTVRSAEEEARWKTQDAAWRDTPYPAPPKQQATDCPNCKALAVKFTSDFAELQGKLQIANQRAEDAEEKAGRLEGQYEKLAADHQRLLDEHQALLASPKMQPPVKPEPAPAPAPEASKAEEPAATPSKKTAQSK